MRIHFTPFWIALLLFGLLPMSSHGQTNNSGSELLHVGVARVDVTPPGFIRQSGGKGRDTVEVDGVTSRLYAKALVFGRDDEGPSVIIAVDVEGVPAEVTRTIASRLGIDASRVAILATRTSGGPEVGLSMNMLHFTEKGGDLGGPRLQQLGRLAEYRQQLVKGIEDAAVAAFQSRSPSRVSWGQGQVSFAKSLRGSDGPVDLTLPILRVTDLDGKLRAVFVNYAAPATTISYGMKRIHGDWPSAFQHSVYRLYPGAVPLVAIGCGGDTRPSPNGTWEDVWAHADAVLEQVRKLLKTDLQPLTQVPQAGMKWVNLRYERVPSVKELIQDGAENSIKGYYSRRALNEIIRGNPIPESIAYPVQVFSFGDQLAMINLGGEVVPEYALRLQNEIGAEKIWVNGYANDASGYIGTRESMSQKERDEWSIYGYDRPSLLVSDIEESIIGAVRDLLPTSFKEPRPETNVPVLVKQTGEGTYILSAETASTRGPNIQYMPEWRALGWFTGADLVSWDVMVEQKGKYDVYMEWSVKDQEAGKPFVLNAGGRRLKGKVGATGSWFTYRTEKIGTVLLPTGKQTIEFKAESPTARSLMDLRSLHFVLQK